MRKLQVFGDTAFGATNWPVANSRNAKLIRTTMVRMNVARSGLMFSTPTLAKIAISAANTADSSAHVCHEEKASEFMVVLGCGPDRCGARLFRTVAICVHKITSKRNR